jgi:hypothetical protein
MQNITSIIELKYAIQSLEDEQSIKGKLLKEQFYLTYESFKPVNVLKRTLNDITSSQNLRNSILSNMVGLITGHLSKKIVVGASSNKFRKLIGSILQVGVTNLVANHPDAIKSFGQLIFQHILRKKERIPS